MGAIPKSCTCGNEIPFYTSLWRCAACGRYICGSCKKSMEHVESGASVIIKGSIPFVAATIGPEAAAIAGVVSGARWTGDIVCPGPGNDHDCRAVVSGANRLKLGPL